MVVVTTLEQLLDLGLIQTWTLNLPWLSVFQWRNTKPLKTQPISQLLLNQFKHKPLRLRLLNQVCNQVCSKLPKRMMASTMTTTMMKVMTTKRLCRRLWLSLCCLKQPKKKKLKPQRKNNQKPLRLIKMVTLMLIS